VLIDRLVNGFAASLFPAFRPVFPPEKLSAQRQVRSHLKVVCRLAGAEMFSVISGSIRSIRDSGENEESNDEIDRG
jgi:hypothetical protein